MFDSQNPMNALGLMYALRLTQDHPRKRPAPVASVSWVTRLTRAVASAFASRPTTPQPARVVKLATPVQPDLPTKRAA